MELRILITPTNEHSEPLYYKDVELPFLPVVGMYVELGKKTNSDIVSGWVTQSAYSFIRKIVEVKIELVDKDVQPFAEHNNWNIY